MRALILVLALVLPFVAASCSSEPEEPADAGESAAGDASDQEPADAEVAMPADAGAKDSGTAADVGPAGDGGDPCSAPGVQTIVSLAASPDTFNLAVGGQAALTVTATFSSGCVRAVTSVYFSNSNSSAVSVAASGSSFTVTGLADGTAELVANTNQSGTGVASNKVAVAVGSQQKSTETRGVWITRFAYKNASATAGPTIIKGILDRAKGANFNAVFLQVRGTGDAYYASSLVPSWGGAAGLGADPGWDPLQVAVDYGHSLGLQVHAYMNAMSGWTKSAGALPVTSPRHILEAHPEYTCEDSSGNDSADGEYVYIAADPGYRSHFADVIEEVITHYDVDGIHLDRIRTPGSDYCHSTALDAAYAASGLSWGDFSRAQIDETVKAVYDRIVAKKPTVMLSAAVWGVHKKVSGCSGGASEGYSSYYQDSLGWAQKGIIDMLNPMTYWPINSGACTDWAANADYFQAGMNGRLLVMGMTAARGEFSELNADIEYARQKKIAGTVVFASAYLDGSGTTTGEVLWDDYLAGPYAAPIDPTPMTHR